MGVLGGCKHAWMSSYINASYFEMQEYCCRCVASNDFVFFCMWRLENGSHKTRPALSRCPTWSSPVSDTVHYFSSVSSKLCGSPTGTWTRAGHWLAYLHFAGCRSLDCTRMACSKFTKKWTVKIDNSKKNGLKKIYSFSLQPAQDPWA